MINKYLRDKDCNGSSRFYFTKEGTEKINDLIKDIASGKEGAIDELLLIITPWAEKIAHRTEKNFYKRGGKTRMEVEDKISVALMSTVAAVERGKVEDWDDFIRSYRWSINGKLGKSKRLRGEELSWEDALLLQDREGKSTEELRLSLMRVLDNLHEENIGDIIKRKLEGVHLSEIGKEFGITGEAVRLRIAKSGKKIIAKAVEMREYELVEWLRNKRVDHPLLDEKHDIILR